MVLIRTFLTRKVPYLLSIFLLTIITLQFINTTEVRSDLSPPLPWVEAMACVSGGGVHSYVTVIPHFANMANVTLDHEKLLYSGEARGATHEERIESVIFITQGRDIVSKNVQYQEIWGQIAIGDLSETSGMSAVGEILGVYKERGKSKPKATIIGRAAYLDDWHAPSYHVYAWCNGFLENADSSIEHGDVSEALYHPYFLIGGTVCDNAGTSS